MSTASHSLDTSRYREEFDAYCSDLENAHFQYRAGLDSELRVASIFERYGHLFTLESIASLDGAKANVPAQLETERAGLHALWGAASIGYLEAQSKDLTDECAKADATAYLVWDGERVPAFGVPKRLAVERSSSRRRDLYDRWIDSIMPTDDLRAVRLESLHSSARSLGFDSYRTLYSKIVGVDFNQLVSRTDSFLQLTETAYKNALARIVSRELPDVALRDLHHADYFPVQRIASLDINFVADEVIPTYKTAMRNLGIRIEKQSNIKIDDTSRPLKHPRASCLRINPPDDVRLLVAPIGGASDYLTLFHEAGHAQHFGWTSRKLKNKNPEFVYSPDYATTESYAFLFNHLFHDPRWLREHRPGLSIESSKAIVRDLAVLTTHTIRRFCAKLRYEITLHDSTQVRSESLAADYSRLQTEATGFARGPGFYLIDIDDGFYSAAYLRAWVFEAGLREYLRTRYGYRWWASPKAGDELIDLWGTASRYSVEELSKLLGMGELDFDMLAETWIASMDEN